MSASLQSHRHSPAEAGSSSIHRSQAEARSHIPASLIDRALAIRSAHKGLVATPNGHRYSEREKACPTPRRSIMTLNGAEVS